MIKTLNLNPYPNPSKTAEIMSRYRPIAPKPEPTNDSSSNSTITDSSSSSSSSPSQNIKHSPYLRNLWPHLQATPTRTRKRGRAPISPLPSSSLKRHKITSSSPPPPPTTTTTNILRFYPPLSSFHVTSPTTKDLTLQFQPFAQPQQQITIPKLPIGLFNSQLQLQNTNFTYIETKNPDLVTLPLLPCSPPTPLCPPPPPPKFDITTNLEEPIELNLKTSISIIPEEKDLLQQLQLLTPTPTTRKQSNGVIIAPQAIRPIGSCISVGCINEDQTLVINTTAKRKEEVEEEFESESLPAIISDSKNRVRMANSAYKEMVGQPECSWLESMVTREKKSQLKFGSCKKRISGGITLRICDSVMIPVSANGFSCWVRIEWQSNSDDDEEEEKKKKKCCVNAFCDVVKLCCESKDYVFSWRFHTRTREASESSSNNV